MKIWQKLGFKKAKQKPVKDQDFTEIAGHKFRVVSPSEMKYSRYVNLLYAFKEVDLGLTRDDLRKFCELQKNCFNTGQNADAAYLAVQLEANVNEYCEKKNLLRIANCIVLIDDEPEESISKQHTELKQTVCFRSQEVELFFLKAAITFLKNMNNLGEGMKSEDYTKGEIKHQVEEAFLNSIGSSIYKDWYKT